MKSIIQYLSIVVTVVVLTGCKPPPQIGTPSGTAPVNTAPSVDSEKENSTKQSNNTPSPAAAADKAIENGPKRLADKTHLPNAYQLTEKVISGGLPEGDVAFQELADLGVKTVISVDGAKPDIATAKK